MANNPSTRPDICRACRLYIKHGGKCPTVVADFTGSPWEAPRCPFGKWEAAARRENMAMRAVEAREAALRNQAEVLRRRGVEFKMVGGRIEISGANLMDELLLRAFSSNEPMFPELPEAARIRKECAKALAELKKNPAKCTACARGKILREHMSKLRPVLLAGGYGGKVSVNRAVRQPDAGILRA